MTIETAVQNPALERDRDEVKAMPKSCKCINPIRAFALGVLFCMNFAGGAEISGQDSKPFRLQASNPDGGRVSLESAMGRRSLLVYWSPESLASRKSLPELQRFAESPEGKNIYLLAVSTTQDADALRDFMAARNLKFPVALRGDDDLGSIPENRLPIVYLLDADGRLLRFRAGMFNLKALRLLLDFN